MVARVVKVTAGVEIPTHEVPIVQKYIIERNVTKRVNQL